METTTGRNGFFPSTMDSRSGFCFSSRTFHSLRPEVSLPDIKEPLSVASLSISLLSSLSLADSHPLYVDASTGDSLTVAAFLSALRSLSSALRSPPFSVSRGHVAFVLCPARLEVPLLYLSLLSIGAVVCPSNPASTARDVARQFRLSSPSIAFVTSSTAALLPAGTVPVVLLDSPDFVRMLRSQSRDPDPAVEIRQEDTAVILFSSGTTGVPKAAALSHRSYIAMIAGVAELRRREAAVEMVTAPMFHSLGMFFAVKGVALGETIVVMDRPRLGEMLRAAGRYGATRMTAAPPLIAAMGRLAEEETDGVDLRRLSRVVCGGAPLKADDVVRFGKRFPWMVLEQGFGMTEGGSISQLTTPEECQNYESVGRLHANVLARVVDPTSGAVLQVGQRGELRLKGPTVMKGYVGDDEATASSFDGDGWLKTGDLCYFDDNGYLYVVDRLKELIKYKAYQVTPAELEQLLVSHEDIIDAAVVPYPHEECGEIPMAFIVRRPESSTNAQEIMDFVANQVAPYKKIRKIAFTKAIPKNPSGKILRRELLSFALSAAGGIETEWRSSPSAAYS